MSIINQTLAVTPAKAGVSYRRTIVLNRIKGFKEIQDEQPIQTGIYLIYGISCDYGLSSTGIAELFT